MKILDIMSKSVKTVGPEESARSVYEKFTELGIHHIPVVDKGKLVGILSTNDYRGVTHGASKNREITPDMIFGGLTVRNLMTENPVTLPSTREVWEAAKAMLDKEISSLPVVDDGNLTGILTANDILRAVAKGRLKG